MILKMKSSSVILTEGPKFSASHGWHLTLVDPEVIDSLLLPPPARWSSSTRFSKRQGSRKTTRYNQTTSNNHIQMDFSKKSTDIISYNPAFTTAKGTWGSWHQRMPWHVKPGKVQTFQTWWREFHWDSDECDDFIISSINLGAKDSSSENSDHKGWGHFFLWISSCIPSCWAGRRSLLPETQHPMSGGHAEEQLKVIIKLVMSWETTNQSCLRVFPC